MARLNEAPCAAVESVEALKRRFIRQNRELAKSNSSQSIRIRCLEAEISRLLAENLVLREESLQLRNELAGQPVGRAVDTLRGQLQEKLEELSGMIAGLGIQSGRRDNMSKRLPTVGWGRGMMEAPDGSDGRLAAIREDKQYPRRTMDAQEIQNMAETSSESPALGPPPVSHFQDEEIVLPEPRPIKKEPPTTEDLASLSTNLETRRKKRDSTSKLTIRRMSVFNSPEDENKDPEDGKATAPVPLVRAGAKRKLASRDDDRKGAEDFAYVRRTTTPVGSADESSGKEPLKKPSSKNIVKQETVRVSTAKLAERRALGEKSVNTDPIVSPKKTNPKSSLKDDKEVLKKHMDPSKDITKSRSSRDRKSRLAAEDICVMMPSMSEAPESLDLPPKTPALQPVDLILSAPSTESNSARPPEGRAHTPPPADLTASTDPNARPGRRARTQVNYAEPSLNLKMRRTTDKPVDAVGRDGRPVAGMLVKKRDSEVKLEPGSEIMGSAWKTLSSVPTSRAIKVEESDERGRVESPLSKKSNARPSEKQDDDQEQPNLETVLNTKVKTEPPSTASQAIAALLNNAKDSTKAAPSRRRSAAVLRAPPLTAEGDEAITDPKDTKRGSSIYDFTSSSPPQTSSRPASRPGSRASDREDESGSRVKTSRRHSSVVSLGSGLRTAPSSSSALNKEGKSSAATSRLSSTSTAGHKRTVSGRGVTPTPSAAAAIGDEAGSSSISSGAAPTDATSEVMEMRASRRRSMMI